MRVVKPAPLSTRPPRPPRPPRRSTALARVAWVLALVGGGCSTAVLDDTPDAGPATQGAPAAQTCEDTLGCPAGQQCLGGVCLTLCRADADCGAARCHAFSGTTLGYCVAPEAGTAPTPGPTGPTDDPAPGGTPTPPDNGPESSGGALPPDDVAPAPPDESPDPTPAPPPDDPGTDDVPPADEPVPPDDEPDPEPTPPPAADCSYPGGGGVITTGRTMPHLSWRSARDAQGNSVDFDLESFHCDAAWARYSVVAFVVGTGWCSACVEYDGQLAGIAPSFEAAGGLFVMVQVEDASYNPASNADAYDIVRHSFGDAPGLRVGDAETSPPGAIGASPLIQSYPTAFVVRRSDMQIIADTNSFDLDYVQLARDNANGPAPGPGPGPAPGGDCTEEPGEPNDTAGQATPLAAGEVSGGVCAGGADFYRISTAGFWHVDLLFQHSIGDLDLYLWDAARNDVLYGVDGQPMGSDSSDDNEAFDGVGPATLEIIGYQGAMAPYRLRFTER